MNSATLTNPSALPVSLLHNYHRVAKLRDGLLLTQQQLKYERQEHASCIDTLRSCHSQLRKVLELVDMEQIGAGGKSEVVASFHDMSAAWAKFESELSRVAALESTVSKAEYKLAGREETLFSDLKKALDLDPNTRSEGGGHAPGLSTSSTTSHTPSLPSLLLEYYDKLGDLGLWEDRMRDHIVDYEEFYGLRAKDEESRVAEDMSQDEFQEKFQEEDIELRTGLEKSKREVAALAKACKAAGIDIPSESSAFSPLSEPAMPEKRDMDALQRENNIGDSHEDSGRMTRWTLEVQTQIPGERGASRANLELDTSTTKSYEYQPLALDADDQPQPLIADRLDDLEPFPARDSPNTHISKSLSERLSIGSRESVRPGVASPLQDWGGHNYQAGVVDLMSGEFSPAEIGRPKAPATECLTGSTNQSPESRGVHNDMGSALNEVFQSYKSKPNVLVEWPSGDIGPALDVRDMEGQIAYPRSQFLSVEHEAPTSENCTHVDFHRSDASFRSEEKSALIGVHAKQIEPDLVPGRVRARGDANSQPSEVSPCTLGSQGERQDSRDHESTITSSSSQQPGLSEMEPSTGLPIQNLSLDKSSVRSMEPTNDTRKIIGQDPATGITYHIWYGPADQITDPKWRKMELVAQKYIRGTVGECYIESGFPEFRKRKDPEKFFLLGKVFSVLWAEPGGDDVTQVTHSSPTMEPKTRMFVVVRPNKAMQYCSVVPIQTYGYQGVAKYGVLKQDHAVIHTSQAAPDPTLAERPGREERGMRPRPIKVNPHERIDKLDPMARVNFGKIYTVEYNVKARGFGVVSKRSLLDFQQQFQSVWFGKRPLSATEQNGSENEGNGASGSDHDDLNESADLRGETE